MPAVSQKQRGYLAVHKGPAWMRKHHFDNKGPLPKRSNSKRARMIAEFQKKHGGKRGTPKR